MNECVEGDELLFVEGLHYVVAMDTCDNISCKVGKSTRYFCISIQFMQTFFASLL